MVKHRYLKRAIAACAVATLGTVMIYGGTLNHSAHADAINAQTTKPVYDISQWQGNISDSQANQLKNEVSFVILKAENGGLYTDPQFNHNAMEMQNNNIPYGAYDYSEYANEAQAQDEAKNLYQRAPQAKFYVNDAEENNAGSDFNSATQAWADEMHALTNKPAVLYSDLSFMNGISANARNDYDALWIADYGTEPQPSYHYDLWQFADNHYSNALGESLDASTFPDGNNKPLSFWIGNDGDGNSTVRPTHRTKKIVNRRKRSNKKRSSRSNIVKPIRRKGRKTLVRKNKKKRNRKLVKPVVNKKRRKQPKKIVYNPLYYRSKRVHYLRVNDKGGINLYTLKGRKIGHVKPGTILWVRGFKTFRYRRTGYMTKAIGYHWGSSDMFTANKTLMKNYRY